MSVEVDTPAEFAPLVLQEWPANLTFVRETLNQRGTAEQMEQSGGEGECRS